MYDFADFLPCNPLFGKGDDFEQNGFAGILAYGGPVDFFQRIATQFGSDFSANPGRIGTTTVQFNVAHVKRLGGVASFFGVVFLNLFQRLSAESLKSTGFIMLLSVRFNQKPALRIIKVVFKASVPAVANQANRILMDKCDLHVLEQRDEIALGIADSVYAVRTRNLPPLVNIVDAFVAYDFTASLTIKICFVMTSARSFLRNRRVNKPGCKLGIGFQNRRMIAHLAGSETTGAKIILRNRIAVPFFAPEKIIFPGYFIVSLETHRFNNSHCAMLCLKGIARLKAV